MSDSLQTNFKLLEVPGEVPVPDECPVTAKQARITKKKDPSSKRSVIKYGLRACSIQKRIEMEGRKGVPKKRGPKPRPKSTRMSKYKRKTANMRERVRMEEINAAFRRLREATPIKRQQIKIPKVKQTKIHILHIAITYIKALENILSTGETGTQHYGSCLITSTCGDLNDIRIQMLDSSDKKNTKKEKSDNLTPPENGNETVEDEVLYPNWSELTSTLEFPEQDILADCNPADLTLDLSISSANHPSFEPDQENLMIGGMVQAIALVFGDQQASLPELEVPETSDYFTDLAALEEKMKENLKRIKLAESFNDNMQLIGEI